MSLFPVSEYWWLYLVTSGIIGLLLFFDLALHRNQRSVSMRQAAVWSAVWIALALAFNLGLYLFASVRHSPAIARQASLEFLAGYIVEESLSVDNMFVFALVFRYFGLPRRYQHRVLFYGVLGAMIFRAIFIAAGSALVRFELVLILFGLLLIVSGVRMAFGGEKEIDPEESAIVRWFRRIVPVTREFYGPRFFVRINKTLHATPLLVVLLVLESTDIIFAADSVPAVFGVTKDPFIVYSSNIFAILGLRAMFFVLAGALDRFHLLRFGLSVVLVFVGLKMVWLDHLFGGRFPIAISLAIISAVIGGSILASLALPHSPGPKFRWPRWEPALAMRIVGAMLVVLAAAAGLCATGLSGWTARLPGFNLVETEELYISAACYLICGVTMLRRPRRG